jgi:hypothetical protein
MNCLKVVTQMAETYSSQIVKAIRKRAEQRV